MNTQSGYGNFSANGMPGTSNLFSVNGQNFNDPFLSLNNSGASNLLLGFNDISEANVITNAYSAQYGQYAGTQVTYITKSGNNQFHGDAIWMWNGSYLNADDFFSNSVDSPRPFDNFNQWATDVNGPIWKNHTFFDVDYEGLRVVLPTASTLIQAPSPQFQTATLANLTAAGNAAEIPFYKQLFGVYNGAPGIGSAVPATTPTAAVGPSLCWAPGSPAPYSSAPRPLTNSMSISGRRGSITTSATGTTCMCGFTAITGSNLPSLVPSARPLTTRAISHRCPRRYPKTTHSTAPP